MQFTKWKEVAELVGLGAIVASLVFVSLQLKQGQEIALATQYQARAEATQELSLAHLEAGYVPFIPELRRGAERGTSAEDINTMLWLWIQMDNHYYQYQAGYLPQDSWEAQLRSTMEMFEYCELRFVYEWRKNGLREEFVNLVATFDDPCVHPDRS
jgi:hypothetical protein